MQPMTARLRDALKRHPRAVGAWIAGGAVILLAVAVGLGIAVLRAPQATGDASAVPGASASHSSSSTSEASPSSSLAEPSASSIPYAAGDPLMQVNVNGLRMRASPSTSADILRSLDRGEVVRLRGGAPVDADGYAWHEVVDLDSRIGWVAMGDGAQPWLTTVPSDPATSPLLLRVERACHAVDLDMFTWRPADVTLSADGRFVLVSGVVRQLSASGFAQVQRDVLQLPALQASATYRLTPRPDAPDPPGHGTCSNRFTLGEGTGKIVVTATNWQGDEEEATYFLPSPERKVLDALALDLMDVEAWLGPSGWSEPARRYVSSSYRFSLTANGSTPPDYLDAPPLAGVPWPFDGPIEQFGEPVGGERCGYLDLGQAFETLRLMRQWGVPALANEVDPAPLLTLDRFGSGNFTTDAGWFSFWLTPRSPDGHPSC
jgi:hypothetical protein